MFPNVKDKTFTDISTNESFIVVDQFEDIAILDNKNKISVKRLLDPNFYEQKIDPASFFSQQNYQVFADKIKSIPNEALETMKDEVSDSIVVDYDPEEERRLLEEKARKIYGSPNQAAQEQIEKFKELMVEDDEDLNIIEQPVIRNDRFIQPIQVQPVPIQEDPMKIMFKNIKKNTDLKITFDISDKIPRPDFIEMMEESYEISLIDYLSDEFTKKILENPNFIKDRIREEINNIVYGKKEKTKSPTTQPTKIIREGEKPISRKKNENPAVVPPPPTPPEDREIREGKMPRKPKNLKE